MLSFLLLACASSDGDTSDSVGDTGPASSFVRVMDEQAEAVLCVRGTAADDVWAVGADMGAGPLVAHWDGVAWLRFDTGLSGNLWSLMPTAYGAVAVGDRGLIAEFHLADASTVQHPGPEIISLLGIWGSSDEDLWAVGGDLVRIVEPEVWRNQGGTWQSYLDNTTKYFGHKTYLTSVWGDGPDDLWIIGTQEILAHFDGGEFEVVERGNKNDLASIHTAGFTPVTVGGLQSAYILHEDPDERWREYTPAFVPQLKGVWARDEQLVAVGARGSVVRWNGSEWVPDPVAVTLVDLTSVWVDPDGGVWVGAGDLSSTPESQGFVAYEAP